MEDITKMIAKHNDFITENLTKDVDERVAAKVLEEMDIVEKMSFDIINFYLEEAEERNTMEIIDDSVETNDAVNDKKGKKLLAIMKAIQKIFKSKNITTRIERIISMDTKNKLKDGTQKEMAELYQLSNDVESKLNEFIGNIKPDSIDRDALGKTAEGINKFIKSINNRINMVAKSKSVSLSNLRTLINAVIIDLKGLLGKIK